MAWVAIHINTARDSLEAFENPYIEYFSQVSRQAMPGSSTYYQIAQRVWGTGFVAQRPPGHTDEEFLGRGDDHAARGIGDPGEADEGGGCVNDDEKNEIADVHGGENEIVDVHGGGNDIVDIRGGENEIVDVHGGENEIVDVHDEEAFLPVHAPGSNLSSR